MPMHALADAGPRTDSFHTEVNTAPSHRSFGVLFTLVFLVIGTLPLWRGAAVRSWALVVAALFLLVTLAAPRALAPLNRLWLRLGLAMHRVINPVVMGALFYLVVTPFGLVRQALGKGLTPRLARDQSANTYWIDRTQQPASRMDQQF
jgi:hypothetical protein